MPDAYSKFAALRVPVTALVSADTIETSVALHKPARDEWFRVSPHDYHAPWEGLLYDSKADKKSYLVAPTPELRKLFGRNIARPVYIFVCVNRDGQTFLSPVGATEHTAHVASRQAHGRARNTWVKMVWTGDDYEIAVSDYTDDPEFPAEHLHDLLDRAFSDALIIDNIDHPISRKIRGVP